MDTKSHLLGFITMAESYHTCAFELATRYQAKTLDLRHDAPIYNSYAHAIELLLKAMLLTQGKNRDEIKKKFGHGIGRAYNTIRADGATKHFIEEVKKYDRESWRRFLREARDKHISTLGFSDPKILKGFDVPDIDDIEKDIPALQTQIEWISKRHQADGSWFRYPKVRYEIVPSIRAFGLDECSVFRSADNFCLKASSLLSEHVV